MNTEQSTDNHNLLLGVVALVSLLTITGSSLAVTGALIFSAIPLLQIASAILIVSLSIFAALAIYFYRSDKNE